MINDGKATRIKAASSTDENTLHPPVPIEGLACWGAMAGGQVTNS